MKTVPRDKSNGYEAAASSFMSARNPRIGASTVREWSQALPPGSSILDLGCGHGVPVSQVLVEERFSVYGVDASPTLIGAFRKRFPDAHAECSAVEDSEFFRRAFEAVVAWGLMFLLPPDVQPSVIRKMARALRPNGKLLFTSPEEAVTWPDSLTGHDSVSLGAARYRQILDTEGLILDGEQSDEGDNHYYLVSKP
ncbi:MAG: class I SAM-dependent methyltransferase [Candidatus Acidiferrum sp.]|jgi:2-polyprenyl-3-methyl-5-hydroxy-6-metoxy-1,4-benzoquinol methylase